MRKFGILTAAFAIIALAAPVFAHHGFDTEYDANKKVKLEGTVTQVTWTNPHMRVYIDVKDKDGKVTTWNMELTSPNTIRRQGWGPDDLKAGDVATCHRLRAHTRVVGSGEAVGGGSGQAAVGSRRRFRTRDGVLAWRRRQRTGPGACCRASI